MHQDIRKIFVDTFPTYDGHDDMAGITGRIEIFRDAIGVPHIRANSAEDGFFAQGWVHAQDRLWQMESDRLKAYGQWASVMGVAAVEQDLLWRRLQLKSNARADFEAAHHDAQAMLTAYAAGVNAYLAAEPKTPEMLLLDHQPDRWAPWDSIAVFKSRHLNMGRWEHKIWRMHILRRFGTDALKVLFPTTEQYRHLTDPGVPPFALDALTSPAFSHLFVTDADEGGSNNWVVAGSRSETGMPILAGDPHRAVDVPNVYYQNHMTCKDFDVIGFSFAGVPGFPHFAHNARVAWSITHGAADTQDIYVETLSADHLKFRRNGQWKPLEKTDDVIAVRDGDDVPIALLSTDEGPVVRLDGTRSLVLKAATLQSPNKTWDALSDMLYASTIDELDAAMENWVDPVNNLLYADRDGNIGYRMRGKLPVRPLSNAWVPVDAESGDFRWSGFVPFKAMFHTVNPPDGYLVTANNQVTDDHYPHYVALDFAAPHRRNRIAALIETRDFWSADAMREIHADLASLNAPPLIVDIAQAKPATVMGAAIQECLINWDAVLEPGSSVALLYSAVRRTAVRMLMEHATAAAFLEEWAGTPPLAWQSGRLNGHLSLLLADPRSPVGQVFREQNLWARALDAVGSAHTDIQSIPAWQDVHALMPTHPLSARFPEAAPHLNPAPIPMGGDGDTVQAASFGGAGYQVTGTSVARYVFDLADWDRSGWVVPLGVSGIATHPHFENQSAAWAQHKLYPMLYSTRAVESHALHHTVLEPT